MIRSYCRVSTTEQAADNATSLTEQQRKNRAIAQLRGVDSFDFLNYVDKGVSGSIALSKRPAGAQMLADCQPGDIIIAAKLDRLFRSSIDALTTLAELRKKKVEVILIDIGTEPLSSSGVAQLFLTMLSAFAEFERVRIAERMTDGRKGKKAKGGHLGGMAPYGFTVIGHGRDARLEPNEDEQKVIALAASLWKRNAPADVCRQMAEQGLTDRAGSPFRIVQVKRMVQRVRALS